MSILDGRLGLWMLPKGKHITCIFVFIAENTNSNLNNMATLKPAPSELVIFSKSQKIG